MLSEQLSAGWNKVPGRIQRAIRGLDERDLDLTGGPEGWSIRENVHHLVEANLIAATMIIAALAVDGYEFDWTWVNPDKSWMRRAGYDKADARQAIKTLRALCRHVSGLLDGRPDVLARRIRVNDSPGAPRYVLTIEKILSQEIEHASQHLAEIQSTRRRHSR